MTQTPKSGIPARGAAPSKFATQESVDLLSLKVDQMTDMLGKVLTTLESLKSSSSAPSPSTLAALSAPVDLSRSVYEHVSRALSDNTDYSEKEKRAVVIGHIEKTDPTEALASDQKLVAELVEYCGSEEVKKAWADQKITHHRHPTDRKPGSRPLKIDCTSKEIRDLFLSGIRSKHGRPTPFKDSLCFIRKDLTPTQLKLEREARDEAKKRNIAADKLVCGVRDYTLVNYSTPRPLPKNYGTPRADLIPPNKSAVDTRSDLNATAASSASDAQSTPKTNDANVNKDRRR